MRRFLRAELAAARAAVSLVLAPAPSSSAAARVARAREPQPQGAPALERRPSMAETQLTEEQIAEFKEGEPPVDRRPALGPGARPGWAPASQILDSQCCCGEAVWAGSAERASGCVLVVLVCPQRSPSSTRMETVRAGVRGAVGVAFAEQAASNQRLPRPRCPAAARARPWCRSASAQRPWILCRSALVWRSDLWPAPLARLSLPPGAGTITTKGERQQRTRATGSSQSSPPICDAAWPAGEEQRGRTPLEKQHHGRARTRGSAQRCRSRSSSGARALQGAHAGVADREGPRQLQAHPAWGPGPQGAAAAVAAGSLLAAPAALPGGLLNAGGATGGVRAGHLRRDPAPRCVQAQSSAR